MFEIISSLFKYAFAAIIYLFILGIIRLVLLDIRATGSRSTFRNNPECCLRMASVQGIPDFKIEEVYLIIGDASIGRSPDNSICIGDIYLSATHATIFKKGKLFYLKDNRSENGTFLNGRRLKSKPLHLKNGDRIIAGRTEFVFTCHKGGGDK